jgi:hypothetical protein
MGSTKATKATLATTANAIHPKSEAGARLVSAGGKTVEYWEWLGVASRYLSALLEGYMVSLYVEQP